MSQYKRELDFANMGVLKLFFSLLLPTILGMLSMALFNIADGAFVGRGVGADGLAAVTIASPIFTFVTGLGLMFGMGCSILASINLSRGEVYEARSNVTLAFLAGSIAGIVVGALVFVFTEQTCMLFGGRGELVGMAAGYLKWVAISIPLEMPGIIGTFLIRLDGSPKYAMSCMTIGALLNIPLDYIAIFILGWGIEGAAIATLISLTVPSIMVAIYFLFISKELKLLRPAKTGGAFGKIWGQMSNGFTAMVGEMAISCIVLMGNNSFMKYLGAEGVAAFGVICYSMPLIFMFSNAIAQSAQPIISFAYGMGDKSRITAGRKVSIISSTIVGITVTLILALIPKSIISIFLDSSSVAFDICAAGMPYYAISALPTSLNIALIGYIQSIKKPVPSTIFMALRGFIFLIPAFLFLPQFLGISGIWLAIPAAELMTLASIVVWRVCNKL